MDVAHLSESPGVKTGTPPRGIFLMAPPCDFAGQFFKLSLRAWAGLLCVRDAWASVRGYDSALANFAGMTWFAKDLPDEAIAKLWCVS